MVEVNPNDFFFLKSLSLETKIKTSSSVCSLVAECGGKPRAIRQWEDEGQDFVKWQQKEKKKTTVKIFLINFDHNCV